jgi:broad specificity phosphatase PhoE
MRNVILVRIAETENNVQNIVTGRRTDSPLTSNGARLAERVGAVLRNRFRPAAFYSGPAPRCTSTARLIAGGDGSDVAICDEFQELDLGDFDGCPEESIPETAAGRELLEHPESDSIPGAKESIAKGGRRAADRIRELAKRHSNADGICIVSHGAVLRAAICTLLGFDLSHLWQFRQDNCAVTVLRPTSSGGFQLSELLNHQSFDPLTI